MKERKPRFSVSPTTVVLVRSDSGIDGSPLYHTQCPLFDGDRPCKFKSEEGYLQQDAFQALSHHFEVFHSEKGQREIRKMRGNIKRKMNRDFNMLRPYLR